MLIQMVIGSAIMVVTAGVSALSLWGLEAFLRVSHGWVIRTPHGPRLVVVLSAVMLWTVALMTASVWIWALALWAPSRVAPQSVRRRCGLWFGAGLPWP